MNLLDPQQVLRDSVLEIRGDGRAGGGLVLAFQSLGALLLSDPELHVQEWPLFSSARRGAALRSFLRAGRNPVLKACEVTRPHVAVLMDEAAARSVDFAQGVPPGGTFVINTRRSPEECAQHYRLSGRVFTVPGDEIGARHLKHAIGNVSVYVAAARAIGGLSGDRIFASFVHTLKKRRIPEALLERNQEALRASDEAVRSGVFDCARPGDHGTQRFDGYGDLPLGAQTALRLSRAEGSLDNYSSTARANRTADYARRGFRLQFEDPNQACTGCAHCITNCPEGIIRFEPHPEKVVLVTGVDVSTYCKLCGECIAVCPEKLFKDAPYAEAWEAAPVES